MPGARAPRVAYDEALGKYQGWSKVSFETAIHLARQATRLLDEAWDDLSRDEHLAIVRQGLEAASRASEEEPSRPEGFYQQAALTGLRARSLGLLGRKTLARIESLCRAADRRDPAYDSAGASRLLGILLRKAPGRQRDLARSRRMLERAVELAPEAPLNHLELALTLAASGEREAAREELSRYESLKQGLRRTPFIAREEAAAKEALR